MDRSEWEARIERMGEEGERLEITMILASKVTV